MKTARFCSEIQASADKAYQRNDFGSEACGRSKFYYTEAIARKKRVFNTVTLLQALTFAQTDTIVVLCRTARCQYVFQ